MYKLLSRFFYKDHPRLRGEHLVAAIGPAIIAGSPPPTRGTLEPILSSAGLSRITPAYAGNTEDFTGQLLGF